MKTGENNQLSLFDQQERATESRRNLTVFLPPSNRVNFPENPEEKGSFGQFLRRRAILILGVAATVTTAVYSWTLNQPNRYEGRFQLLVEPVRVPNGQGRLSAGEAKQQAPNLSRGGEDSGFDYESQLQVLQSPQVMLPIIKQVRTRYPDIDYNSLFSKKTQKTELGEDALSIKRLNQTKIIEVSYRDSDPKKIQFVLDKVAQGFLTYSRENSEKTNTGQGLKFVQSQLPVVAKQVENLQGEVQKLRQEYKFIDPQIQSKQLAEQINQIQNQRLEAETQLNQQRSLYELLQVQVGLDPQQALMASALSQAPTYQGMLTQLQQLEVKIATESATYTEASPQLQSLLEQHKNILPLLKQEAERVLRTDIAKVNPKALAYQDSVRMGLIQQMVNAANQIQLLGVRTQVLNQAAKELNQYAQVFPAVVRRYGELQQQLEIANKMANSLLAKREALQLEAATQMVLPWELISQAQIPQNKKGEFIPFYPVLPLNLALGGVAGLVLGVGVAALAERLSNNKVFRSPQDVKHTIRLPLLGVIPASDRIVRLPPTSAELVSANVSPVPTNPFHEAFRSLNANIRLLKTDRPVRSCAITSCQVADGKSTVAVNLAAAAAAMGQRVLLVDADLRRPQVHEMLHLPNQQGLSSVIAQDLDVEAVWQRSQIDPNLYVLTSGPIPADPTKLLSSRKMQHLMGHLSSHFDLIVYDTPPLLGLADANLLGASTDGLMLVVGINQTEREALLLALEDLKMAGIPLLGMVANGDKGSYYSQYYAQDYVGLRSA